MIRNIVFDVGNVLMDFHPLPYVARLLGDEALAAQVVPLVFHSDEWLELDRGTITQAEAEGRITSRNPALAEPIRRVFDNWMPLMTPMEATVALLPRIRAAGYGLYYLSNFHELSWQWMWQQFPFFQAFHGGVVSYPLFVIKPEPGIYLELLRRYDLPAGECVFLDDREENVQAAEELGFHGLHVFPGADVAQLLIKKGIAL